MKNKIVRILISLFAVFSVLTFFPVLSTSAANPNPYEYEYVVELDLTVTIQKYTGRDKNITVPSSISGYPVAEIGENAFEGCDFIEKIIIPAGILKIDNSAFSDCSSLTSIVIPQSVKSFGDYIFKNCSSLESITIPASVEEIGKEAFSGCTKLSTIHYKGPKAQWREITANKNLSINNSVSIRYGIADSESVITGFILIALILLAVLIMWLLIIKKLRR